MLLRRFLVELYLNFDNDQVEVSDANIYSGLCEVLCALAEGRLSEGGARVVLRRGANEEDESALMRRRLRRVALDALARVTRCLMDTSATVHLMRRHTNRDSIESIDTSPILKHASRDNLDADSMGWEQDESSPSNSPNSSNLSNTSNSANPSNPSYPSNPLKTLLHNSTNMRSSLEMGRVEENNDSPSNEQQPFTPPQHVRTYSPYDAAMDGSDSSGSGSSSSSQHQHRLIPTVLDNERESLSSNESNEGTPDGTYSKRRCEQM